MVKYVSLSDAANMNYEGMIYRPPSEVYSLILQATVGCAHNRCSFCTMYRDKQFHTRGIGQIEDDLKEAARSYAGRVRRIFLADGDALALSTEKLTEILRLCKKYFPEAERVTSYATAEDVLRKTKEELKELRGLGLRMVYMGAESGSGRILKHIHKDTEPRTFTEAAACLKTAGIKNSVTLISGLGGQELLEEHAIKSAELISRMKPEYLGFLTLMLEPGAPMLSEVERGDIMKKQYILFDLDGTLTDPKEGITKGVAHALAAFGIQVDDPDTLTAFIGPPLYASLSEFYGFDEAQIEKGVRIYREYYGARGMWENYVYDGIPELLRRLKEAGKTILLATSKPQETAEKILEKFGLLPYFDHVAGAAMDVKDRGTKADVIARALEMCGSPKPQDMIMVGDRKYDVEGAAVFGIDTIGVTFGYGTKEELDAAGAVCTVRNVEQLDAVLLDKKSPLMTLRY